MFIKKHTLKNLLFLFLFLSLTGLQAQGMPSAAQEAQARAILQRKGVDETELKNRLRLQGLDVDRMSTAELMAARPQIEATIAELEAEKKQTQQLPPAPQKDSIPLSQPKKDSLPPLDTLLLPATEGEVWGHALFRNRSLEVYQANDNVRAPNSYRLGAGDAVAISIFGASQADLKFIIDTEGFIRPPGMPRIYLKGIALGKATELVESRFRQYYSFQPGQFSFTVDAARSISVNVFGETKRNGSFTISAVNTAFNAIIAGGGLKESASIRQIKLLRNGSEQIIDVYRFLLDPASENDFFLENNDIIFVPIAGDIVQIEGAIARPMRYELLPGETVADALFYAGGLLATAAPENLTLLQTEEGREKVININLKEAGGEVVFHPAAQNDGTQRATRTSGLFGSRRSHVLRIPSRVGAAQDFVAISGAVSLPGAYAFQPGMGLRDLLAQGQFREDSRRDVAFLRRQNPDSTFQLLSIPLAAWLDNPQLTTDYPLERLDELIILSVADFASKTTITVTGAVRDTLTDYPYSTADNLTVADGILLAGGLRDNASNQAFLIRTNPANTQERQYLRVDISTPEGLAAKLRPNDELRIFPQEKFSDPFPLTIKGAVRNPGTYTYDPSLGLADLLTLAGGLKLEAARNKIDIFRLILKQNETTQTSSQTLEIDKDFNISSDSNFQLQPYDVVVVRSVPEFELIQTVKIQGAVRYPGDYALDSRNLRLSELVNKSGGLTVEAFPEGAKLYRQEGNIGYVVIRLFDALANPKGVANITLKDGDILEVPKALDLVAIRPTGTQATEIYDTELLEDGTLDIAFSGEKSAKWYIDKFAAGFNSQAKRSSLTVQYPNGELGKTKKLLFFNSYPKVRSGSSIQMTLKAPKKQRKQREEPIDWVGITQVTLGGLTTLLTLYLLLEQRNQ